MTNINTWPNAFSAANQELIRIYAGEDELPLSQYPNDSMMTMKRVTQNSPGIFEFRGTRHHNWLEAVNDGLWFQGYWRVAWQFDAIKTASIDPVAGLVYQAGSVNGGIGDKYTRPYGNGMEPYKAINLIEEIDLPGEWAVHFNSKKLYIWLPEGVDEIQLLDLKQPLIKTKDVSYTKFINLNISYSLGVGIVIENGTQNLIAGCDISKCIDDAIQIINGTNHSVQSNDLHHLGAGGILLSGGDRVTLTPANHSATNNHIYEFGQIKVIYAPAIYTPLRNANNNVGMYVAHNKIHGTPHVAIQYSGNNNVFEYNDIYDICRVSNDMGAFYSWADWTSYGNVVRYNYIHDSHQAHGAYYDDGDSGDSIYYNIMHNIDVGVFLGGGHDNIAFGNLAVNCEKAVHIDNRGVSRGYNLSNSTLVNRVLSVDYQNGPWAAQYPSMHDILETSYSQELPVGSTIDCNIALNTNQAVDIDAATASAWEVNLGTNYSDTDANLSNPLTTDLAAILAASGYAGEGCMDNTVDWSKVGLIEDEYRTFTSPDMTLGNASISGGSLDGWKSNMVINEEDTYTNTSGSPQTISITNFSFYAGREADPLTPFVVKVHGDNDFTVLRIGTTRTSSEYTVGQNTFDFKDGGASIELMNGETIAMAFLDANPDGSGGSIGSVIPFDGNDADEIWYSGGGGSSNSGSIRVGEAPIAGSGLLTTLRRNYHFNIGLSFENTPVIQGSVDNWKSNMVIKETETYTNTSGSPEIVHINSFDFYAGRKADPLTPFVVKVHGDNDFTVLKIGTTRTSSAYRVGQNSFGFKDGGATYLLNHGETIAFGFLDANPDGSGGTTGSVIPYIDDNDHEIWYSGGSASHNSGSVIEDQAPIAGSSLRTTFSRDYHFDIDISVFPTPYTENALGNPATSNASLDGWKANMCINEEDTYTNTSGNAQAIIFNSFNFYAGRDNANPVTPFIVKVNGDNDFNVLKIGTTRTASDYNLGQNNFDFKNGGASLILNPGETIAIGFMDAYPDGSGGGIASTIPFNTSSPDEIWYTGGTSGIHSARLVEGQAPINVGSVLTTLERNYHFNIGFRILESNIQSRTSGNNNISFNDSDSKPSILEPSNLTVNIFPNPAKKHVYLEVNKATDYLVTISNLEGKIISSKMNSRFIQLDRFEAGLYLIEISDLSSGYRTVEKLVVAK